MFTLKNNNNAEKVKTTPKSINRRRAKQIMVHEYDYITQILKIFHIVFNKYENMLVIYLRE